MARTDLTPLWIFLAIVGIMGIVGIVLGSIGVANLPNHIDKISGVGPVANEVFLVEDLGIDVTPNPVTHTLTVKNVGVRKVNSRDPTDGNILLSAGNPQIEITNGAASNEISIWNRGVLQVNSRDPLAGNILLTPGAGMTIVNGGASNELVVATTAVLTVNSRSPTAGNIVLNPLTGISIANGGPTNQIDIGNSGVTSNVAGAGMSVSGATGAVTITHTLSSQALLADTDPLGPQVRYSGLVSSAAMNTWVISTLSAIGDGQGNVGGTAWQVPATGLYDVHARCVPPANRTDYEALHLALTFAATSDDPEFDGYVAGRTFSRLGSEKSPHVSVSALIQAGCTSCAVANGAGLKVHAYLENVVYTASLDLVCAIQVTRLM